MYSTFGTNPYKTNSEGVMDCTYLKLPGPSGVARPTATYWKVIAHEGTGLKIPGRTKN